MLTTHKNAKIPQFWYQCMCAACMEHIRDSLRSRTLVLYIIFSASIL